MYDQESQDIFDSERFLLRKVLFCLIRIYTDASYMYLYNAKTGFHIFHFCFMFVLQHLRSLGILEIASRHTPFNLSLN